ncbi:unnamed protein product [Closterium sp. Yama58-4]|nr:unnamed protein product [Closterium sp. Yama58-4]
MLKKATSAGPSFTPPGRKLIMGRLLEDCKKNTDAALTKVTSAWSEIGVCIASDGWTDGQERPQLNFLAVNTQASVFLFGVDCGSDKKTGLFIAEHLKTAINMVGSDNVVGVLMDGASSCVSAANIIKDDFPKIQYIRCAAHSLNNLIKDIGARPWAAKTIEDAQGTISTLKNSHWVTGKLREQNLLLLLKPAGTRFGTNYIALERLLKVREVLDRLVTTKGWEENAAKKEKMRGVKTLVRDDNFWKGVEQVLKVLKPVYLLLRGIDSNQEVMGKIYDKMFRVEDAVNEACRRLPATEKNAIAKAVSDWWNDNINCALHVVGRILYPPNQFEKIFGVDKECSRIFRRFIREYYDGEVVVDEDGDSKPMATVIEEELMIYLQGVGEIGDKKAREDHELIKKVGRVEEEEKDDTYEPLDDEELEDCCYKESNDDV